MVVMAETFSKWSRRWLKEHASLHDDVNVYLPLRADAWRVREGFFFCLFA